MKKVILAFDSYKNCRRANAICQMAAEILRTECRMEGILCPLSDGGEGFVDALLSRSGSRIDCPVHDPLGRPGIARAGIIPDGGTVVEMASASGLELLKKSERNALVTSTFGFGELLKTLIQTYHRRNFLVGIGGSATVDGGMGMLQALGWRFFDGEEREIPIFAGGQALREIRRIDGTGALPELKDCRFQIASDVTNRLYGPDGAARVFGPQKGATREAVEILECGLQNFAAVTAVGERPGDGAAGGVGYALRVYCNGEIYSGANLVLDAIGFDALLDSADLVLTGEGRSDAQTLHGKLCSVVAARAAGKNVPCILISGAIEEPEKLVQFFDQLEEVTPYGTPPEVAIREFPRFFETALKRVARDLTTERKVPSI
ncbi:MAG: glycerate kinase [Victivallaceae bacterium]|nr:glycerate kinase [Victivallaceae bacterium]